MSTVRKTPAQIAAEMVSIEAGLYVFLNDPAEDGEAEAFAYTPEAADAEDCATNACGIIARLVQRVRDEQASEIQRLTEERDRALRALETTAAKAESIQPEWSALHVLHEVREAAGIPGGVSIIEHVRAMRRRAEGRG